MITVEDDENLCCWDLEDQYAAKPVVIAEAEKRDGYICRALQEELSSCGTQATIVAIRWIE